MGTVPTKRGSFRKKSLLAGSFANPAACARGKRVHTLQEDYKKSECFRFSLFLFPFQVLHLDHTSNGLAKQPICFPTLLASISKCVADDITHLSSFCGGHFCVRREQERTPSLSGRGPPPVVC
uniref:Uncharacterized protein n=1 Tax=Pseudictyota dubia TaxID=2749911 RepID=A0A7R9ZE99_9STRA|mmetsp:Transcript_46858/g.86980  ORF Transcript_46858/g.86980 Transcript_46858/m.86980 type:complete len:123 (+) Transcript_46858:749-1117(+)